MDTQQPESNARMALTNGSTDGNRGEGGSKDQFAHHSEFRMDQTNARFLVKTGHFFSSSFKCADLILILTMIGAKIQNPLTRQILPSGFDTQILSLCVSLTTCLVTRPQMVAAMPSVWTVRVYTYLPWSCSIHVDPQILSTKSGRFYLTEK
ncbi:hypothetical protein DFH05DRAFT_1559605 [Lentinula detonsa]|uniref:Uncharacterized protein n=1 Tax=Lentinula detonsa TaxID=2804962 RepID=A0A9W8TU70_9AGAR|nr:hypothetical protein DFH05DRAFT_1559605 [Lentinula detonsa]